MAIIGNGGKCIEKSNWHWIWTKQTVNMFAKLKKDIIKWFNDMHVYNQINLDTFTSRVNSSIDIQYCIKAYPHIKLTNCTHDGVRN